MELADHALKFLGADGSGTTDDAISAILYARAKGVPILNNSWGGGDVSEALRDAIEQTDASGELFVAAAGNDFTNTDVEPFYPASYDVPNVLVVGASDQFDRKAWFSNYGVRTVDLSAPGTNVYSTWPGATYRFADGTSMATPQVSGAAALARAVFPNASGVGLKALLLRDVDPIGVLNTASRTGGRLNVDRAARCAGTPQAWIDSPANGTEVSAGQPLEIRVLGALCGSPGGVSVSATLNGSPFPLDARGDGLYSATHVPQAGAVNLTVTATAGAASDVQSVTAMANQTYQIVLGGSPVTITTHSAGENAWLTFNGQAGQRIALRMSGVTIGPRRAARPTSGSTSPTAPRSARRRSSGRTAGSSTRARCPRPAVPDPRRPAADGDRLDDAHALRRAAGRDDDDRARRPAGNRHDRAGSGSERARDVLRQPGPADRAQAEQRHDRHLVVLFRPRLDPQARRLDARLRDPVRHERRLRRHALAAGQRHVHDPRRPAADRCRLGDADALRRAARRDEHDHPGGPPVTVSMGPVPGQNAVVTFSGTQGQRIALGMSNVTIGTVAAARPGFRSRSRTARRSSTPVGRNGGFLDTRVLPATGTYTILVDPQLADLGSMTLTLRRPA